MIKVTVELDQYGLGKKVTKLAELRIGNDGTGSETVGNYMIMQLDKNGAPCKHGYVKGHKRKGVSVLKLVAKALKELGHGTDAGA